MKESICDALVEIRDQISVELSLLVVDNYGSHHAKLTQQLADKLDIEFVFLAPSSQTLNAIKPL